MTFDEQLPRAFETLADRFRDEIARHWRQAAADLAAQARTEREAAVADTATRVRAEVLQDADARIQAAVSEAEANARDGAARAARDEIERLEQRAQERVEEAARASREEIARLEQRAQEMVEAADSAAREHVRSADLAASERLIETIRGIDAAHSLTEILDALASGAGREAARVALLLVRGGELHGWRFLGFDSPFDNASSVVIAREESGILGEALSTGGAVSSDSAGQLAAPAFAALPAGRESFAFPVTMNGDAVAVVYADQGIGGEAAETSILTWPDRLELIARHAARSLEAATAVAAFRMLTERPLLPTHIAEGPANHLRQGSSGQEAGPHEDDEAARRYARLLVSEIKLYHEGAVLAGRREGDLGTRLGHEIARARALFQQRVPGASGAADHFHEELVRTLAGGDARLLGQEKLKVKS